jgi:hypothetical protein
MDIRKHWISLRRAHAEQVGWNNKWFKWYYPYSKWLSIVKGLVIALVIGGGFHFTMGLIKYFGK